MFLQVKNISLPVSSVESSGRWYAEMIGARVSRYNDLQLGFFFLPSVDDLYFVLTAVADDTQRLGLRAAGRMLPVVTFYAPNISEVHRMLQARGVAVGPLDMGEDGPYAFGFEDPDGNCFAVTNIALRAEDVGA